MIPPLPFRRGEGRGEGSLGVVYPTVPSVIKRPSFLRIFYRRIAGLGPALLVCFLSGTARVQASPAVLDPNLQLRLVMYTTNSSGAPSIRIARDPRNDQLYYLKENGDIFLLNPRARQWLDQHPCVQRRRPRHLGKCLGPGHRSGRDHIYCRKHDHQLRQQHVRHGNERCAGSSWDARLVSAGPNRALPAQPHGVRPPDERSGREPGRSISLPQQRLADRSWRGRIDRRSLPEPERNRAYGQGLPPAG